MATVDNCGMAWANMTRSALSIYENEIYRFLVIAKANHVYIIQQLMFVAYEAAVLNIYQGKQVK